MPCYRRGQPAILHMGLQINLGRRFLGGFENAFMEICQADSVEYLGLYDKYFIGWLRKYKPPAGRKTRLRVAFLMGLPVKNAFALLLTKVIKHIPPQTSPVGSSLAGI